VLEPPGIASPTPHALEGSLANIGTVGAGHIGDGIARQVAGTDHRLSVVCLEALNTPELIGLE
jgi:hypothetical protein